MFTHKNRPIPVRGETTPTPSPENCKIVITEKLYSLSLSAFRYPQPVSLSKPELGEIPGCRYFCTAVVSSPHLLSNTHKSSNYELRKLASEADSFLINHSAGLCYCSNGNQHRREASATHPLRWSEYHLSTCSSFSTQTSFGQMESSSVYNSISAEGIGNRCWLPRTEYFSLTTQTISWSLFMVLWMGLGLHPLCFRQAAMSVW